MEELIIIIEIIFANPFIFGMLAVLADRIVEIINGGEIL